MEDTIVFLKNIKTVKVTPKKAKDLKEEFNKYLKKRRIEWKSAKRKITLENINMLFNGRNDAIVFIEDFDPMILEARKKAFQGQDLRC